jgi:23S rRNA (guanosine2251-2'-O)-methyltransferase
VTPVVLKAAAGALEYLAVYRVTNLADCLARLKDAGLAIIGTEAQSPRSLYDADLTQPLALVIGSEDKGLRPRVRQQCDLVLAIPMAAPEIGSLNAATAAAVALFEARRQRSMLFSTP